MPFTLAHPAIILPVSRRYFHFPALVLGSMSPDFSSLAFLCWNTALPVPLKQHGILIVRVVDCFCIALCLIGLVEKKRDM